MVVDPLIVEAIAETYTREQIVAFKAAALAELLGDSGAKVTSSSFQDQSTAGVWIERPAKERVALCKAALDYLDREDAGSQVRPNPQMNHMDMRGQHVGW
jgi:hypothetical protein